ncbi:MAG: DUF2723 domain-containing protein [Bacteroidales bacterium]
MIKYLKHINLIGWLLGIIASVVYIITMEPSLSFWDSGEYISTASKLQVGHPPGAPLYQVIGAFFSIFAFSSLKLIPMLINSISAISAGITITFLFWIIVRLLDRFTKKPIGNIIAGIIGALTFAFTDSFWNNAIEAEVYSLSLLITTIIFWAILKWEAKPNNKWLIFIGFLLGLSIGVHFLSLLVIPTLVMVYYFKKFTPSTGGFIISIIISFSSLGFLLIGFIPGILKLISLNPLISSISIAIFFILIIFLTQYFNKPLLNTISLVFTFFIIGFSIFFVLVIRAKSDTPINEYKPDSAEGLISYLNRDAYGETPLVYGPAYTALPPKGFEMTSNGLKPEFDPQMMMFFPRVWNYNNPSYESGYIDWIGQCQDSVVIDSEIRAKPSWNQNLKFFASYQVGYMYVRYLLWNFSGRTNDLQGYGDNQNGQWKTGIEPIDLLLGRNTITPPKHRQSMANNSYFAIPLILALIGIFYQIGKDSNAFVYTSLLFLLTSIGIIIYSNEYAYQPRERDYIYTTSFMIFSIWMAMGAFAISQWIVNIIRVKKPRYVLPLFLTLPALVFANNFNDHNRSDRYTAYNFAASLLGSCSENSILIVNGDNDTFPLWYCQEVENIRRDVRVINLQLLNSPEYIENLQRKVYSSDKINLIANKKIYSDKNRILSLINTNNRRMPLDGALRELYYSNEKIDLLGLSLYTIPTNKFYIPTNQDTIEFNLKTTELIRSTYILLDIIASNVDNRDIYFSLYSMDDILQLNDYLQLEGFAYKLHKKKNKTQNLILENNIGIVNTDKMYENFIHNYSWKNFSKKGIYYDELNRSIIEEFAKNSSLLAHGLLSENKDAKALSVANLCLKNLPADLHYYPYSLSELGLVYSILGEDSIAKEVNNTVLNSFSSEVKYYLKLKSSHQAQGRLREMKLIQSWINICDISENLGLEEMRIQYADALFQYLSSYVLTLYEQLYRLKANPYYYDSEISQIIELLDEIHSFAKKYEEPLPKISLDNSI